ncbi:RseA family anti-sigma factor [Tepidimonas sp.]|uniref:RseA family anti-sigma factor n=1 Tax=Tepidimonas sp. TaxID=2002775 RepID=UPI002FE051BB
MNADRVSNPTCGADTARREWLSALLDGEAQAVPGGALDADDDLTWDAYHCIGEALRAQAAAQTQAADPAFVRAVMARIAQEPPAANPVSALPTAPTADVRRTPRPAANDAVFRWKMVAGVATLAAVLTLAWQAGALVGAPAGDAQLAQTSPLSAVVAPTAAVTVPTAAAMARPAGLPTATRDPQLDELLAAHRQWGGASALQSSAGFLRTASVEAPAR